MNLSTVAESTPLSFKFRANPPSWRSESRAPASSDDTDADISYLADALGRMHFVLHAPDPDVANDALRLQLHQGRHPAARREELVQLS